MIVIGDIRQKDYSYRRASMRMFVAQWLSGPASGERFIIRGNFEVDGMYWDGTNGFVIEEEIGKYELGAIA
jgi:hypothetical protein